MKRIFLIFTTLIFTLFAGSVSAQQSDATLEFSSSLTQARVGDEFDVQVIMQNPGLQNVISVRSWLEYNPNALEGVSISTDSSPFTLSAPGENEFDAEDGHVKIGRSNISGGVSSTGIVVATVRFRVKTSSPLTTVINAYDYQTNELGHTSVNIIDQGFPVNILGEEPEELRLVLNDGAQEEVLPEAIPVDPGIGGSGFADLQRPANLRVNTGTGYVDLRWDISLEQGLSGYNIYYGKTSGQYTRRRTAGKLNQYRLDGLNNNEIYYFAVTAYDALNRESDYSDEVAVIVGQPLSSTAPFEELLNLSLAQLPAQPQNGPLTWWLLISAAGLSWVIVFRKKRLQ